MAPSYINVLRKIPRDQQERGLTFLELTQHFLMREYGSNKAKWAVRELVVSAQLQTKRGLMDEEGNQRYFAVCWPFAGIETDVRRICPVIWGRRREYCHRIDGRDDEAPWVLS